MKKLILMALLMLIIFTFSACRTAEPTLMGFYQGQQYINGYIVQISFFRDDHSFIQYIDNREVDRGSYQKVEDNIYRIQSDQQDFDIQLNKDNTFDLYIKKINNEEPIVMQNISKVPTTFGTPFDDVEEYKKLIN